MEPRLPYKNGGRRNSYITGSEEEAIDPIREEQYTV
jgi:hypothetical protein